MMSAIAALSDRLLFFLGVNTGFVTGGVPDYRYIDFYRKRSFPDLHCAIVGNVVVPGGYGSNDVTPVLSPDRVWSTLAEAIRSGGSLPGIQLATAWANYIGSKNFRTIKSQEVIKAAQQLVASLGREGIIAVLNQFDRGATIAVDRGFAHVQMHAAHGYLLGLIVDQRINPDAPRALERLANLGSRLRAEKVETSIRISLKTGDPEFDQTGSEDFLDSMAALPIDFVDLSSGFYNIDKRLIYPALPSILEDRLRETLAVAFRHPKRAFILSGRSMRHRTTALPSNVHFGFCRDLIANPRFLFEPENGCHNHGKCHYFSRGDKHLTCPRWAKTD
jgi:2,4-dienoyl-CoA reductase-like NADH-dependent reductase (Old Yellow Enzyme family)